MQGNICLMWPWMIFCIMGIIGLPLNLIKAIVSIDFGSPNAGNYLPGVIFGIIATLVNMFLVIYLFLVVWNYKRELEATMDQMRKQERDDIRGRLLSTASMLAGTWHGCGRWCGWWDRDGPQGCGLSHADDS